MKKDAYYFSHDANAQDDPKIMLLIDEMGMEGVGIYWCLVEKLRAEKDYKLQLILLPLFAKKWNTEPQKVENVVKNYELFKKVGKFFFSVRLRKSMIEKTNKAKASASIRWSDANAIRPHNERNTTDIRRDAIRRKEIKKSKAEEDFSSEDEFLGIYRGNQNFDPPGPGMVY